MAIPRLLNLKSNLKPSGQLTGAAIARDAQRYAGGKYGYTYGGTGARPGDWDCSSFVSYVLGHDLGFALPGGTWQQVTSNGTVHGPVVVSYADWNGATTVGTAQAGDLCCWVGEGPNGHVGIAISADEMVSALNPDVGTVQSGIVGNGPAGAPLIYRRVAGVRAGGASILNGMQQSAGSGGGGGPSVVALVVALAAPLIVVGVAAVGTTVLAAAGAWALRKAMAS
jgi:cell wall-associated NlpC family hydrolase